MLVVGVHDNESDVLADHDAYSDESNSLPLRTCSVIVDVHQRCTSMHLDDIGRQNLRGDASLRYL